MLVIPNYYITSIITYKRYLKPSSRIEVSTPHLLVISCSTNGDVTSRTICCWGLRWRPGISEAVAIVIHSLGGFTYLQLQFYTLMCIYVQEKSSHRTTRSGEHAICRLIQRERRTRSSCFMWRTSPPLRVAEFDQSSGTPSVHQRTVAICWRGIFNSCYTTALATACLPCLEETGCFAAKDLQFLWLGTTCSGWTIKCQQNFSKYHP